MSQGFAKRTTQSPVLAPTDLCLVGSIQQWASASIPSGWLNCNGNAVSRTTYAELYAIIGTTWGVGDNSTTFNLPDFQGTTLAGVGTSVGYTQAETVALATKYNDSTQGHWHDTYAGASRLYLGNPVPSSGSGTAVTTNLGLTAYAQATSPITDGTNGTPRTGNVTKGKTIGVYFIIKAFNVNQTLWAQGVDGATLSTDGTMAGNSDSLVPSQKAVRTYSSKPSTVYKQADYVILDGDGYARIEVDTTAADRTITLPLKSSNMGRRIEIANVKGGTNKVIIAPHATDANKLTNDGLAAIWLPKVGDFVVLQESQNSGYWEVVNERITAQLRLDTYSAYGATETKIPKFTNITESIGGTAGVIFSENHSTGYNSGNEGLKITINRSGIYYFKNMLYQNAQQYSGITKNSAALTTAIENITDTTVLASHLQYGTSGPVNESSWSGYLAKGAIIRPHNTGSSVTAGALTQFHVTYLGQ